MSTLPPHGKISADAHGWTFGNTCSTYVRARTFSTLKQVKPAVKTEIEYRPKTTGGAGAGEGHLENFSTSPEKCVGHSLKL